MIEVHVAVENGPDGPSEFWLSEDGTVRGDIENDEQNSLGHVIGVLRDLADAIEGTWHEKKGDL